MKAGTRVPPSHNVSFAPLKTEYMCIAVILYQIDTQSKVTKHYFQFHFTVYESFKDGYVEGTMKLLEHFKGQ